MNPYTRGVKLHADIGSFSAMLVIVHGEPLHLVIVDSITDGLRSVSADDLHKSPTDYPARLLMFTDEMLIWPHN